MAATNILFEVSPILPNGNLTTIRMSAAGNLSSGVYLDGHEWLPLITDRPTFEIKLTNNGLLDQVQISYGSVGFNMSEVFGNEVWSTYDWTGALGRIWVGSDDADFDSYEQIFEGSVSALSREYTSGTVTLLGTEADLNVNLLYDSYEGNGGAEGPSTLKGTLKPWASGACLNVDPVLVDTAYLVYQVHGYGPIQDIPAVYEFAQKIADPVASVNTYAELIALTLVPGQWAKCLPLGMFRLGGQPSQKLTADVHGAKSGSTFPSTVSGIIRHLVAIAAPTAAFGDLSIFDDVSWCYYTKQQATLGDIARKAALDAGGYLFPDGAGVWQIGDFFAPKTAQRLSMERDSEPLVVSVSEETTGGPVYKVRIGADRCWSVHSEAEVSPAIANLSDAQAALNDAAEAAQEAAEQAKQDAALAQARLAAMSDDTILDRAEKKNLARDYATLVAEKTDINAQSAAFPDATQEFADYNAAFNGLDTYLDGLSPAWDDGEHDTPIARLTFQLKWNDLYQARAVLLTAMSRYASNYAQWNLISDPLGTKPQNNATVGAPNLTDPIGGTTVGALLTDIENIKDTLELSVDSEQILQLINDVDEIYPVIVKGLAATDVVTRAYGAESLQAVQTLRTDVLADGENYAEAILNLNARVDNTQSSLATEQTTRANGDTALTNQYNALGARTTAAEAAIVSEQTARANGDSANANSINALQSVVNGVSAAVSTESSTRASADTALSNQITTVQATLNGNITAAVQNEATARANADSANASQISGLLTRMNNAESAITTEQSVRASGDATNASSVNSITSRLNNQNGVTLEQRFSTQASQIGGLQSQYTVRINNNGVSAGFGLASGAGGTSAFAVQADQFLVTDANRQGQAPFIISGGVTYIADAAIRNASIVNAKIADLQVGGEKIVASAVTGVGAYDSTLNGYHYTPGSYTNLPNVAVGVTSGYYDTQRAVIWFSYMAERDGGDDDNISIRLVRNDGVVLGDFINIQIHGGRRLYSCTFIDQSVSANSIYSYQIQYYSLKDGSPYWYDTTLIAMVLKK